MVHLAVGATSKRISDREDIVDPELFERHSRSITLTLAGQSLRQSLRQSLQRHAQRILADVDYLTRLSQLAADSKAQLLI